MAARKLQSESLCPSLAPLWPGHLDHACSPWSAGEVDRTFKRITEGVELFEAIYEKMQQATNQPQKEKRAPSRSCLLHARVDADA